MKSVYTILIFISSCLFLQAENIDSLLSLSEKYQNINLDSSIAFALKAKELAYKNKKREDEINAINLVAAAFSYKGDLTKFKEMNTHAIYLCEKYDLEKQKLKTIIQQAYRHRELFQTNETIEKIQLASGEILSLPEEERKHYYPELYEAIGYLLYNELRDSIVSLEYLHKAQNYYLQEGDTLQATRLYLYLGELFRLNGRTDRAANYYQNAKEVAERINDSTIIGKYYRLKSAVYLDRGNVATALQLMKSADTIFTNIRNYKQLSDLYSMFAYAYSYIDDYQQSLRYNKKSLALRQSIGNKSLQTSSLLNIANSFKRLSKIDSSLYYAKMAYNICINMQHNYYLPKNLKMLSKIYQEKGNFRLAHKYLSQFVAISDSLRQSKHSLISLLEEKSRFSHLDEIMHYNASIEKLLKEKTTTDRYFHISLGINVLLLVVFLIRSFRKNKSR